MVGLLVLLDVGDGVVLLVVGDGVVVIGCSIGSYTMIGGSRIVAAGKFLATSSSFRL